MRIAGYNHRAGNDVHKVVEWTPNAAMVKQDSTGKASNTLSIRVVKDSVHFIANGKEVKAFSKADMHGFDVGGQAGLRINHNLDVHIASFTVTPDFGFSATVGGTCGGALSGTIYTTNPIGADCTVSAAFPPLPRYDVTPSVRGHGTIAPATPVMTIQGQSASFTLAFHNMSTAGALHRAADTIARPTANHSRFQSNVTGGIRKRCASEAMRSLVAASESAAPSDAAASDRHRLSARS